MILGDSYPDLVSLHRALVLRIARAQRHDGVLDDVRGSAAISFTNTVFADSCDYESFDLGHVGFTPRRWQTFCRQYIDAEQFDSWVRQSVQSKRNGAELVFLAKPIARKEKVILNETSNHLYGNNHRWGNCLIGLTFGFKPAPLIVMHSRTSALTKGGALDLTLASIAARRLAAELGIEQTSIAFCWMSSSFQVSCWQLLTLAAAWGLTERLQKLTSPTGVGFNRYVTRGRTYNYASSLRAHKMADLIAAGEMPQTLVKELEIR